jgi:hypothetical protein
MGYVPAMNTPTIEKVRQLVSEGGLARAGRARAAELYANAQWDCTEPALQKLPRHSLVALEGYGLSIVGHYRIDA